MRMSNSTPRTKTNGSLRNSKWVLTFEVLALPVRLGRSILYTVHRFPSLLPSQPPYHLFNLYTYGWQKFILPHLANNDLSWKCLLWKNRAEMRTNALSSKAEDRKNKKTDSYSWNCQNSRHGKQHIQDGNALTLTNTAWIVQDNVKPTDLVGRKTSQNISLSTNWKV
jgi:hypothetical protein